MADPKELFITNCVTREQIAENLNDYLKYYEHDERFAPDDDRLTGGLCREYAAKLGALPNPDDEDDKGIDRENEQHGRIIHDFLLKHFGIECET
jgi:hypothetical protein